MKALRESGGLFLAVPGTGAAWFQGDYTACNEMHLARKRGAAKGEGRNHERVTKSSM